MFVRTKQINKNTYAYLVENKWVEGRTVQSSKKYLGRVFSFPVVEDFDFMDFIEFNLESAPPRDVLKEVVAFELFIRGFSSKKNIWSLESVSVNISSFDFSYRNKPIALASGDGFLCKDTIMRILKFKSVDREKDKYALAKLFVEAGIRVHPEAFAALYLRLSKDE